MSEPLEDQCERCGNIAQGRHKLMFYSMLAKFPNPPIEREFYCLRCLKIMRIYAIIASHSSGS